MEVVERTLANGNRTSSAGFIQPPTARSPDFTEMDGEIAAVGRVSPAGSLLPALRTAAGGGRPRPAESCSLPAPEPPHASRKAKRSALMVSACVVGMPCGKPL